MKSITIWSVAVSLSQIVNVVTSADTGPITSSCVVGSPCASAVDAIPSCGQGCLNSAGSAVGCAATDYACQCASSSSIQGLAQDCVLNSCAATAISVLNSAAALCSCVSASPSPVTSCAGVAATATQSSGSSSSGSFPPSLLGSLPPSLAPSLSPTVPAGGTVAAAAAGSSTTCAVVAASPDCGSKVLEIPSCATSCFLAGVTTIGCSVTDYVCQCTAANVAALTADVIPCIAKACAAPDIIKAQQAATDICNCANAPPTPGTPSSTTCYAVGGSSTSPSVTSGPGSGGSGAGVTPPLPQTTPRGAANKANVGMGMLGAGLMFAFAL